MSKRNHHGGEPAKGILHDFSVSLNPLGPPETVRQAIRRNPDCLIRYPDPECTALRETLSRVTGVPAANIVCGNGSADLIYRICSVCGFERVLLTVPAFSEYERALLANDCEISYIIADRENGFTLRGEYLDCGDGYDAIFVSNPVNPSGSVMDAEEMDRLLEWCEETDTVLVLDECFLDFVNPKTVDYAYRFFRHYVNDPADGDDMTGAEEGIPEVIAIRSFTKSCALAGLRIGYALFTDRKMAAETAESGAPWMVSGPAQEAGIAAAEAGKYLDKTRTYIAVERAYIMEGLRQNELEAFKSETNYVLFRGPAMLGTVLLEQGLRIRDCSDFTGLAQQGGQRYYRIGIQSHEANEALLDALPDCLQKSRRAQSVMIQGTMSNAGKSLIAAGLCRIFAQDGFRTAPFKSQNMALNSFITADGKEIGRAQAVQAEAAYIEPSGDMNPVLLKPTSDEGSQVIVNGKARGNMKAAEYFKYKKELIPDIMAAYDRLASASDLVVIEGAGSPVELNLLEGDIVNMGLAERTDSPVILVGDIDRGGIFAQLAGTLDLLSEKDRSRVIGVIVNKFRGDLSLFEKGRSMLEELCGVPVLGVVPYMDLDIDEEDSLSERFDHDKPRYEEDAEEDTGERSENAEWHARDLVICVIRLPRISNYTDLTALSAVDGVQVRYIERPDELDEADAIIIPGTKSTISDMKWMHERGLSDAIWLNGLAGIPVIGICGGFQMLGQKICDPFQLEGPDAEIKGIDLLPIETDFADSKVTRQIGGRVVDLPGGMAGLCDADVMGYEIHMGRTRMIREDADVTPFCQLDDGSFDGCVSDNIIGTYLHGLFDSADFTERFLQILWERAGEKPVLRKKTIHDISWIRSRDNQTKEECSGADSSGRGRRTWSVPDYKLYRQEQYDRLADGLRASLDMEKLYSLLDLNEKKDQEGEWSRELSDAFSAKIRNLGGDTDKK